MYPNPQGALPLPPQTNLDFYRKLAKDLVKAFKAGEPGDPALVREWATRWVERLAALDTRTFATREEWIEDNASELTRFALDRLSRGDAAASGTAGAAPDARAAHGALAAAQFVIARAHGFLSWPKFASHLDALARSSSAVSAYEAAADAIVAGDMTALQRLLRDDAELVRARSGREHNATLLHYVSANGVEGYRQKSPKNAPQVARLLLEAGADVDAEADVYGSGCTTLGLVATSSPPRDAGVQLPLIDALLEFGARMDHPGSTGHNSGLIRGCLANGCPEAAEYLVERGAPLDFAGAAGTGQLDAVRRFFTNGAANESVSPAQLSEGLAMAAAYGHADVVEFLLDSGIDVDRELQFHGEGHTALHVASYHATVDTVRTLLRRGARVDLRDKTWGTTPLSWVLTGWRRANTKSERFYETVSALVAAGSEVKPELLEWDPVRADPRMSTALNRDGWDG
jgi:ankyrin repeat protein